MPDKKQVTVLSLGGGVQSTALAVMLEDGMEGYPKPDFAVFADTQSEPPNVYETLDVLGGLLSYPIYRPTLGNLGADTWATLRGEAVPHRYHTGGSKDHDLPLIGDVGLLPRQCTGAYKVDVVKREIRKVANAHWSSLKVREYIGISYDEVQRMRNSDVKYIYLDYPLAYSRITRNDCKQYLDDRNIPVGRSACYFCPFHSIDEWRNIREKYPDLYKDAVNMDAALMDAKKGSLAGRAGKIRGLTKVMELADAQSNMFDKDQWGGECGGHCGV